MRPKCVMIRKFIFFFEILLVTGCSSGAMIPTAHRIAEESIAVPLASETNTKVPLRGKIAFTHLDDSGYRNDVYVMNADGSRLQNITPPDLPSIGGLTWSPDGEYIAFDAAVGNKTQIFKMRDDGTNLKQLTFGEEHAYTPSWSPDGKYIIFLSFQKDVLDYRGNIAQQGYIMKSDGSEVGRLRDSNEFMESATYRYDGFISIGVPATRYTVRFFTIDLNGSTQSQFPGFTLEGTPDWSPDGNLIVYNTIRPDCSGLIVMKPDGSNQNCLNIDEINKPKVYVTGASWSMDGKYILFSSNIDGDWDIYLVKPDGSELKRLTDLPGDENHPVWAPIP